MSRYAQATDVTSDRSKSEIERTLTRYGADQFAYGWTLDAAMIGFVARDRQVRFILPMPNRHSSEFSRTPTGRVRAEGQQVAAYEQAVRQRWRALALVIKAKLEAVESGIVTFEEEFAMHMLLPNGETVGQWVTPQIERAYETREMPLMLAMLAIESAS